MAEKRRSMLSRIKVTLGDPAASFEAPPETGNGRGAHPGPGGAEAVAAAVVLAIDRRRRARKPLPLASPPATPVDSDLWAIGGRLAQVERSPERDPWKR